MSPPKRNNGASRILRVRVRVNITAEELIRFFCNFGRIKNVNVVMNRRGLAGAVVVNYENSESVPVAYREYRQRFDNRD